MLYYCFLLVFLDRGFGAFACFESEAVPRAQAGLCSVLFSFTVSLSAGIGNLAVISNDPTMKDGRHYLELGAGNFEQYFTIDGIWSIMHYNDHYYG